MTTLVLPPFAGGVRQGAVGGRRSLLRRAGRPAAGRGHVEGWLQAWSTLEELVTEAAALGDDRLHHRHRRTRTRRPTTSGSRPRCCPGWRSGASSSPAGWWSRATRTPGARPRRSARFRTPIEIFREENVPIFAELEELSARYQRITGSMTAEWDGVERPLPQLQPFLKSPDRAVRERAFRAATSRTSSSATRSRALFDRMYELRQRAARNAGFANFRDYIFPAKFRFDYTPADCERFHDAVERTVAPAVERMLEHAPPAARARRAPALGPRRWIPTAQEPLRPFATADEFVGTAHAGCSTRVDPALGRRVPDHDRRAAARSREPEGQGAGRLLRDAPLPRAAVHLHERRRPGGRRHDAAARGRPRLPRLCRARAAAHLAAASRAPRPPSWRRCPWSCWPRRTWPSRRLLRRGGSPARLARAPGGRPAQPGAHRVGGCIPDLDLHQRGGRRRRGAGRGLAPDPVAGSSAASTGAGWSGSGSRAGTASCTSSCTRSTTSSTASPSSARSRSGATACDDPGRRRGPLPRGARARRRAGLPEIYRAAGAALTFDAEADRRAGGAGRGGDRAGPGRAAQRRATPSAKRS